MQFKNLDLNQSNKKGRIIIKLANLQKNAKGINQNMTKLTIFSKKLTLKSKFNGLDLCHVCIRISKINLTI